MGGYQGNQSEKTGINCKSLVSDSRNDCRKLSLFWDRRPARQRSEKLPHRSRSAEDVEPGPGRVASDRFHQQRPAAATIRHDPAPESGVLARSPHGPPGAAHKREVEQKNRVCRAQPHFHGVIETKVAIQYPSFFLNEPPLQLNPFIARRWKKAGTPE